MMGRQFIIPAQQQGATLIVALIFLLVLTAAGITAMRFSTFEERMASNTQLRNQTFQQAQSEIRAHILDFNTNVALRAPLLIALNENTAPREPADLLADPALKSLPETARLPRAIDTKMEDINPAENTVRFAVETFCPGSNPEKFTCLHFEMNVTAELAGGTNSWQSQGITYESPK